jgi:DNA-binding IclR family transcriptional regulator
MTREDDWREPGSAPARPHPLTSGLMVLAQFDSEAALDQADIARLTGCSGSIARRYLVMLCDLGYLTEDRDGAYRLSAKARPHHTRPA